VEGVSLPDPLFDDRIVEISILKETKSTMLTNPGEGDKERQLTKYQNNFSKFIFTRKKYDI
jgi:hypothetical protein